MVEQLTEAMPADVRQAFADAVRLYSHWKSEPLPQLVGFCVRAASGDGGCRLGSSLSISNLYARLPAKRVNIM